MKIDEYVNRVLRRFWPEDHQGNRKVWFHSQNLNEDRNGDPKGLPWEGRAWLHVGPGKRTYESAFEWNLWSHFCGVSVKTCGESGGLQFHAALPPVSVWLTLPIPVQKLLKLKGYGGLCFFDIDYSVEGKMIHWQFGGNEHGDWSSKTPKWKHGSFDVAAFVLGRTRYIEGEPEVHRVTIPMPEGGYEATVELRDDRWKRRFWVTKQIRRAKVDVPLGIPHMGKGENDYDCGEDRCYGFTGPCDTVEEAVGKMVESALNYRRRYDGNINAEYLPPSQQEKGKDAKVSREARA